MPARLPPLQLPREGVFSEVPPRRHRRVVDSALAVPRHRQRRRRMRARPRLPPPRHPPEGDSLEMPPRRHRRLRRRLRLQRAVGDLASEEQRRRRPRQRLLPETHQNQRRRHRRRVGSALAGRQKPRHLRLPRRPHPRPLREGLALEGRRPRRRPQRRTQKRHRLRRRVVDLVLAEQRQHRRRMREKTQQKMLPPRPRQRQSRVFRSAERPRLHPERHPRPRLPLLSKLPTPSEEPLRRPRALHPLRPQPPHLPVHRQPQHPNPR